MLQTLLIAIPLSLVLLVGCGSSEPVAPIASPVAEVAVSEPAAVEAPPSPAEPVTPANEPASAQPAPAAEKAAIPVRPASADPTPTLTFEAPIPLTAAGAAIDLGNHAAPRLVDWNGDGALDLLVAGGDGKLWVFRQGQAQNGTDFLAGERIGAADGEIQVGGGYSGACFADFNGDEKPDLIAAGNDHRLRYYPNVGTTAAPAFERFILVPGAAGEFKLLESVGGRIEIADWDQDGLADLLTGDFHGSITWYRNTGTPQTPAFAAPGIPLTVQAVPLNEPYNVHPRVLDINRDGRLDLAFGMNWGLVKLLLNTEGPGITNFATKTTLRDANGKDLGIRELIADDAIPDFADLTGDGVLDLISGGKNGKLFALPGISYERSFQQIEAIMAAHPQDLAATLSADEKLREKLLGLHRGLRHTAVRVLPLADRPKVRDWYRQHLGKYPQYLRQRKFDPTADAYLPYLAGQVWVNLFESLPDSPEQRRQTAEDCGLTGTQRDLLVDQGMFYLEAGHSTPRSQRALYEIAQSIPPELQIVEVVTQTHFLQPAAGAGMNIEARTAVNVFSEVGGYSEGFPAEVPQTLIDGFSVVVAHELNHNTEHAAGRIYPWFWDRKFDLLEQAAPPELAFRDHNAGGFGLDLPATQARFREAGHWDGVNEHWKAAYDAYWKTGPGKPFNRRWLRDNLRFCIDAPQEAFATLSNQYFTSSDMMLQLAVARWNEGIKTGINQFLFFADVYSLGKNETLFYRIDTAGQVTRSTVPLERDAQGHIRRLITPTAVYDFTLDAEGNVLELRQTSQTPK